MPKHKWNIVFMGTPDFALPALQKLIEEENVIAVFTQPDRPSGRGQKLTPPPVKKLALQAQIPCYQPSDLKEQSDEAQKLKDLKPDLIVVVAYGLFLPASFLEIATHKAINIHPSLLPKYRGAAPLQWALINGDEKTGVSIVYVTPKMDAGDILLQKDYTILPKDNLESMKEKLSHLGAELLIESIQKLKTDNIDPVKQDNSKVVLAPKLQKDHGLINWTASAKDIFNLIRGANPWPGTYTYLNNAPLKIHTAKVLHHSFKGVAGKVHELHKEGLTIETPAGLLLLTEVQKPNRKKMSATEFLKGSQIQVGQTLGKKQ